MDSRAAMRSYTKTAAQAHSRAAVTVAMTIRRSLSLTFRFLYALASFIGEPVSLPAGLRQTQ